MHNEFPKKHFKEESFRGVLFQMSSLYKVFDQKLTCTFQTLRKSVIVNIESKETY